jgi:UTP:GlnB (protein PII) uridylyltransferase
MVAPIACVATGSYAAGRPEADAGLLLVISEHGELRRRGERVAGVLAFVLGELEAGLRTTVRAPADCALLAEMLPSVRRSLAQRRFLRGRYALFEAVERALQARAIGL